VVRGKDEVVGEKIGEGGVEADEDGTASNGCGGREDETAEEVGFCWGEVGWGRSEESSWIEDVLGGLVMI
jgi:hypothetical protein